jgi:hypothetical protein
MGSRKRQRVREVGTGKKERLADYGMRNNRQTGYAHNSLTVSSGIPGPLASPFFGAPGKRKTVPVAENVDLVVG